jgi:hypothetical protein
MLGSNTRIREIPLPLEYDPDFGKKSPIVADGFVISVYNRKYKYDFILLLPNLDCDDELQILTDAVVKHFLDPTDNYLLRDLADEDVEMFLNTPIPVLCYHPASIFEDKISFYWQYPPKHLMS